MGRSRACGEKILTEEQASRVIYVSPRQYRVLKVLADSGRTLEVNEISVALGLRREDLMRDIAELENKGLLIVQRTAFKKPVLTDEGKEVIEKGLPEERVHKFMYRCIDKPVPKFLECIAEQSGLDHRMARIGLQHLVRHGCLRIIDGVVRIGDEKKCFEALEEAAWIRSALLEVSRGGEITDKMISLLRRRKLIQIERMIRIAVEPIPDLKNLMERGLIKPFEVTTVITPGMAEKLDKLYIKEFDLSIEPPKPKPARLNAYMEFLDMVREILVSMGFEEVKGPHVELEFWNFDALFQPQDHPAREIHDTFFVDTDFRGRLPEELLERARSVHERSWKYKWNPLRALRPVLRSQTTAVSVRTIYERREGEYRAFSLDRVFRPETLDAKHAMEFYQLDGIIVGKNVNLKHLLAFFKEFVAALGIKKVWFKPGYFPFTEPSVEGFIKHPTLGWIEALPGGVFRPEVMEILGAPGVKAIAWGIGIDRLAMAVLGIDDIRDLFTSDLQLLRNLPEPIIPFFVKKTSARDVEVVSIPK